MMDDIFSCYFWDFSLSLSVLTMTCLAVDLFVIHWVCWIHRLIIFTKFRNFQPLLNFCLSPLFLNLIMHMLVHLLVLHISLKLCSFFFSFSLFSRLNALNLPSNLHIQSSSILNLLLSSHSEFSIYIICNFNFRFSISFCNMFLCHNPSLYVILLSPSFSFSNMVPFNSLNIELKVTLISLLKCHFSYLWVPSKEVSIVWMGHIFLLFACLFIFLIKKTEFFRYVATLNTPSVSTPTSKNLLLFV